MKCHLQIIVILSALCANDLVAASPTSSSDNAVKPATTPQTLVPAPVPVAKGATLTPLPTLFKVPGLADSEQPKQPVLQKSLTKPSTQTAFKVPGSSQPQPQQKPVAMFKVPGSDQPQPAPKPKNAVAALSPSAIFKVPDVKDKDQKQAPQVADSLPKPAEVSIATPQPVLAKTPDVPTPALAAVAKVAEAPAPAVTPLPTIAKTPDVTTTKVVEAPKIAAASTATPKPIEASVSDKAVPSSPLVSSNAASEAIKSTVDGDADSKISFVDTGRTILPRIKSDDSLVGTSQNSLVLPSIQDKVQMPQAPVIAAATTQKPQAPLSSAVVTQAPAAVVAASIPKAPTPPVAVTQTATPVIAAATPAIPAMPAAVVPQKPQVVVSQVVPAAPTLNAPTATVLQKPQTQIPVVVNAPVAPKTQAPQVLAQEVPAKMPVINVPLSKSRNSTVVSAVVVPAVVQDAGKSQLHAEVSKKSALEIHKEAKREGRKHHAVEKHRHGIHEKAIEPMTPDRTKFIDDEMTVLTLPDDDIVLGGLTQDARISEMTGRDYIKVFWSEYDKRAERESRLDLDLFVATIENHSPESYQDGMQLDDARDAAFEAARASKLSDLRVLIESYPVLQSTDTNGETLLQVAIDNDDTDLARFLLAHGIDLRSSNSDGSDALSTAHDQDMIDLLTSSQ